MNTLQGIFDNGPTCKRNFIQENARQLRTLQQSWKKKEKKLELPQKSNKFQHIAAKVPAHVTSSAALRTRDLPSAQTAERTRSSDVPTRASGNSTVSTLQSADLYNNKSGKRIFTTTMPARKSQIYPVSAGNQSTEFVFSKKTMNGGAMLPQSKLNSVTKSLSAMSLTRSPLGGSDETDSLNRAVSENSIPVEPIRSLGCQTISPEDVEDVFNEGVIKYPSTCNLDVLRSESACKTGRPPTCDSAQQTESSTQAGLLVTEATTNYHSPVPLDNITSTSPKEPRIHQFPQPERLLQRLKGMSSGVGKNQASTVAITKPNSPKKGRSKEKIADILKNQPPGIKKSAARAHEVSGSDCPLDYVPLPEAERLETLRILQKSYEDHIRQLNSFPVKTDTLKMRLRKIDIEKQLNKLEEGIKAFSRPKVFVKIGT